jgi:hypothetical protein
MPGTREKCPSSTRRTRRPAGAARLHYTLATGKITSKEGAGVYARETFPDRWHPIIDECLRIRRRQPNRSRYRSIWTRRHDALAFLDYAITDAHRIDNHGDAG